jgi:hypothetical protein
MALLGFSRLPTALIATAFLTAASLPAFAAGAFDALNGNWSGAGTVHPEGGSAERIRCNASYKPSGSSEVSVTLRCASDSYNFNLTGSIRTDGHSLSGQWTETSRSVGGTVSGTMQGDRMQMHIDSSGFSADLGITTRGRTQSVSMDSRGGGQIVKGTISMAKH